MGMSQHIPLLSVLMLGLFLAILNQTLLNVALPHLITEFNTTTTTAQWLLTGYMLVNGVLIPLSAFLIRRFGVRILFLAAMLFFTIGSLICGLSPTFSIMLIGRLIQAVGGGILMPLVMTIILSVFPPEIRGRGMGILGLAMMFAPAVGPTLSGWVVENYSWRLLFNGMVPLGILVFVLAFFLLRNRVKPERVSLDVWGTITSIVGFGGLLYGFSEAGSKGWGSAEVVMSLIVGLVGIVAFVLQQLGKDDPMLDFRIFRYDIFTLSNIISVIITIAMYAGMFLLPIYLQNLRGFTPLESGLLLLPGAIVMGAMSPVSGALFDKIGPRPLAILGMLITTVTTYEFTHLSIETSFTQVLIIYMFRSFGMSFLMMPIMTAGLNQLPERKNSDGTAMSNTLRQISGSIGISLVTTIFSNRTTMHLGELSDQTNIMSPSFISSFGSLVDSVANAYGVPAAQAKQMAATMLYGQVNMNAAVLGINDAFYWAAGISFVGLVLSFFLRDVRKDHVRKAKKERAAGIASETSI
ncbi:DHA2 family efflux MFS transporter permease subunit [Aneurinibacillus sp. Ricciae_BoGa-3]|uniref:DHA2 family efflux MFS transporter permease subunit n=1 Tax=Aneurinibacillus sp. Ricciae_BoGa-3 TaxID=3022697 RepID=UPI0023415D69|nr:DHA2 family efflux MFS transporter permease subunit [Aneurinibacillus sp. Ricciae_BoGa-3]WCK56819.1 DHA2 family efflux MFS transporter permease subunit [Aneurinibacillus sp. Ricciae_BoGa-3]